MLLINYHIVAVKIPSQKSNFFFIDICPKKILKIEYSLKGLFVICVYFLNILINACCSTCDSLHTVQLLEMLQIISFLMQKNRKINYL